MKFKLPQSFDLAGQTFVVIPEPSIKNLAGCCGQTHFDEGLVLIDPSLRPDTKGVTFHHELVHAILMTMGRKDLNSDESFVDNFGNLLWQYVKTSR